MSRSARAFHRHAREVLEHELRRARGQLAPLPRERRLVVEEVATRVATALVDGVLEQARGEPVDGRCRSGIMMLRTAAGRGLPSVRATPSVRMRSSTYGIQISAVKIVTHSKYASSVFIEGLLSERGDSAWRLWSPRNRIA